MAEAEATAVDAVPADTTPAQRWLARLAFVAAAAAIILMLAVAGVRGSIALILVGSIGVPVSLAGAWWFLTHRGLVRWLAAVLVVAGPVLIAVLYARAGLVWVVIVCALLWSAAVAAGRIALTTADSAYKPTEYEVPPPRRPFLIMNPRSGGGKVVQFGLAEKARELGATVALLEGPGTVDVAALARQAVDEGADLLGVAGGDGTQALVAGIAAERGIPFMVISAGTRNHFALDLGLDREDPPASLTALTDGVELHIDLGQIGDRTFVNNASFGAYAAVVQSPAYRDDKTRTTLDMLPDLLTRHSGPVLRMRAGETVLTGAQAILVSNNPYGSDDIAGLGRRTRIDGGVLGVLAVTVRSAADAASLVRGRRSKVVTLVAAGEAMVDADTPSIPVGIDGEAVSMPAPVRCVIRPGALRVRVPRQRPGNYQARPVMDWTRLRHIALSTGPSPRR